MTTEEIAQLRRAIEIGRQLILICDTIGQEEAGNHIVTGLEIMTVAVDLHDLISGPELKEQLHGLEALVAKPQE